MSAEKLYQELVETTRNISFLQGTQALLEWDQQTKLPKLAGSHRSEQVTFLASEIHRHSTAERLGGILQELSDSELARDPHSDSGATIRELKRNFDKKTKLPPKLVEELARTTANGQQVWIEARQENDFAKFAPVLKQIFELKRNEAEALGYEDCRYDALLDEYEPHAKTKEVAAVLDGLKQELVPLVAAIQESQHQPDPSILKRKYPIHAQARFGRQAAAAIGFDFDRGRIDTTHHPFCTEMGPNDVRLTTRYDENFFNSSFFGTLHESGHGIYEQGLRGDWYGLPPGQYCSLGIHESQSRLWENLVGRSRSFWEYFYPQAQALFPEALNDVPLDAFYSSINHVAPSLIRVEADEATYNLHIIIRFELEQELINGQLETDDLPDAWNSKYAQALGITPDSDSNGVMQDIHWSAGLVGYFSTYSLGNLYASQFFGAAKQELGDLDQMFAAGDFAPLKNWLNREIHERGKLYSSPELGHLVTGKELSHEQLMSDLRAKLSPIYHL